MADRSRHAQVRVGVIGAGFVGLQHVEALRRLPNVRVDVIAAGSEASATGARRRLGVPRSSADFRTVVDDPSIDVVHVCTPNDLHHDVATAALEAGKHVICEKPLARDVDQARRLVELAGRSGRQAILCHNYRFYPMVSELRAIAQAGDLGALHTVRGHYLQDWLLLPTDSNWRLDPERSGRSRAIADIGSHWLDLAEVITGQRVTAVLADTRTVLERRARTAVRPTFASDAVPADGDGTDWFDVVTEDEAGLIVRFDGGARGHLFVSQVAAGHKNDLEITVDGSGGSASWRQETPDELRVGRRDGPNELRLRSPSTGSAAERQLARLPAGHGEGWADALRNLFDAAYRVIRGEQAPLSLPIPLPTFSDGLRHLLATEAALDSAQRGSWVDVPVMTDPGGAA